VVPEVSQKDLMHYHEAVVRPVLEYASPVWHTIKSQPIICIDLITITVSEQSAQDCYVTEMTVVSCSDRHASLVGWLHT